jgi:hypothetical protein
MNAPLEMGTLDGPILTCAMHCAQPMATYKTKVDSEWVWVAL